MLEMFLGNLVEITLSVAVIIAGLLLLSPLISRKYTAKWRYYIWLILALRLLVPFNVSLPVAPIRLEPRPQSAVSAQVPAAAPQMPAQVQEDQAAVPPLLQENGAEFTLLELLLAVWALGAVAFLVWQAVGYCRFLRFVRRWGGPAQAPASAAMLDQLCVELQVAARVRLAICPKLQSPMMTGLMHPVILLPHEDYGTEDLYFVLRHELTHLKRRDLWYKLLLLAANAVHWFNPLVYLMVREANKDAEFSCDDAVVAGMSAEDRGKYGDTILSAVCAGQRGTAAFSTYFYGGKGTLKKRLANLFDFSKKRKGVVALCAVLVVACVAGGLIVCEVQPPSAADGELAIVSLANSVLYNKEAGELEFHTPQVIPEKCKLYIHVSGRTLMQDGMGMSWHAYEEETETFDWGLNQTYFAYITPEDIDFIEITVGLVDDATGAMRYETVISVDAQGNVSDNKSYRPIGAKSGPEVFEVMPAMTEENERFAQQYLQPALYSGLLYASFSPGDYEQLDTYTKEDGNMTGSPVLLHFFEDVTGQEQMLKLLIEYYSSEGVADLPADLVETTLLQYFELTKAQLHAVMSHYEPATNTYRYSGGRGGGEVNVVVTGSRKDGDLLLLDYDLFSGPPGNFRKMLAGNSTIRVEQDSYKYVANEMNYVTEGTAN